MPKGPSGGMQLPGGFTGTNSSSMPPQLMHMIRSMMGNSWQSTQPQSQPQPQSPAPVPLTTNGGGGGFWNPNHGMPSPSISNTPSTTNPTTPFSMPQAPLPGNMVQAGAPPGAQPWNNLSMPPVRGGVITGQPG